MAKWERTRHEQAKTILVEAETKLIESYNVYTVKIEREQIAINEIESLYF